MDSLKPPPADFCISSMPSEHRFRPQYRDIVKIAIPCADTSGKLASTAYVVCASTLLYLELLTTQENPCRARAVSSIDKIVRG
jgi:hypothetical protein